MAKNHSSKAEPASTATRYDAFVVQPPSSEGGKAFWNKIGVAFPHSDAKGFNMVLHALPVDGKVVLRLPEPKEDPGDSEA